MPRKLKFNRNNLLLGLQAIYDNLSEKHGEELRAIGSKIPIGGNNWMDLFFRMEGIRGVMTGLRLGKTLEYSIIFGKDVSSISVKIWNGRRGYQVHRWEETAHRFVENSVRGLLDA